MQPNATELKVSPLLATRNEANQGRLAHRVRVSGGPNEARVASFPASQLGVNRAKQGQMGPVLDPPSEVPAQRRGEGDASSTLNSYRKWLPMKPNRATARSRWHTRYE